MIIYKESYFQRNETFFGEIAMLTPPRSPLLKLKINLAMISKYLQLGLVVRVQEYIDMIRK